MMPWLESFHRPTTVPEALRLLKRGGRAARFVAGGTELLLQSDPSVKVLVDVTRLKLAYIKPVKNGVAIGAATTLAELGESKEIQRLGGGILARAATACAPIQIRNRATIGGILANASPAADILVPLLALDAEAVKTGTNGRRRMPLYGFFQGPRRTALNGALLAEVFIPKPPRGGAWSFQKLARLERDLAIVSVAVGLGLDRQGYVKWVRLALGAAGPTVVRVRAVEMLLAGMPLSAAMVEEAAVLAQCAASPVDDVRATAGYRREMVPVLARRALLDCAAQLGRML